jgi:4-amino-4-deoxy-L-arabinose transferase-like glycosyltransferase
MPILTLMMLRTAKSNPSAFWAAAIILVGSGVLLFTHLGTYALWDDESLTAMTARSVWRTGDTSVRVDDHNLLAYNHGLLIKGFYDRYSPPLQFYFLAPFLGLLGQSTFICRLPFALCGLLTVCLILRWLWQINPPALVWWSAAIIILTDASFFLFNRQCRYYGLAMLFSVAVAFCYERWNRRGGSIVPLVVTLVALQVSHYLDYAGVVACLAADYFIWGRHRRALLKWDWVKLMVPQMIVGAVVWSIWNPAARSATVAAAGLQNTLSSAEYASTAVPFSSLRWFRDYFILLGWNWRDMLHSNFFIIPLLLVCPMLYIWKKESWLLRAPAAVVVFIVMIVLLTAHPIRSRSEAEIRYLTPLLPLGIGIGVLTVWAMQELKSPLRYSLMFAAAASVFLAAPEPGLPAWQTAMPIRFYHELWQPQREPFTPVAEWINRHVAPGATVYVQPSYMNYPLMFHAGNALYAWQLPDPPKPEYAHVNDALIEGRVPPDYLIAFGPYTRFMDATRSQLAARGIRYEQIDTIHVFWHDLFRPERIFRFFTTVTPRPGEEVYVYRRMPSQNAQATAACPQ